MKNRKNQEGMVLAFVIIVGAIMILTGTALLAGSVMEVKTGNFVQRDTQAYFTARSAVDALSSKVVKGNVQLNDGDVYTGNIGDDTFTITVTKNGSKYTLESEGVSKDQEDIVELVMEEKEEVANTLYVETAIFGKTSVNIGGNGSIIGGIGTNAKESANPITIGGSASVSILPPYYDMNYPLPDPKLPAFPVNAVTADLTVSGSQTIDLGNATVFYDVLKVEAGGVLTINQNGSNSVLSVNSLIVSKASNGKDKKPAGEIIIKSGSKAQVYINSILTISGKVNQDATLNHKKLEIYYNGTAAKLSMDGILCSYFHCGNISFEAIANKSDFTGVIVSGYTGEFNINGNTRSYKNLIYAPFATLNKINGNANYMGSVVVNIAKGNGTAGITYSPVVEDGYELPGVIIPPKKTLSVLNYQ
ncbi:MAG: hypothetical protein HGA49_03220 [Eubacteriaceae bacterium]|nr:hypothetical protein [Eubacteriaceae bacterium]